jgi:hypothetical protein
MTVLALFDIQPPTVKRYARPETIMRRFYQDTPLEGRAREYEAISEDGQSYSFVEAIEGMGFWGFCDYERNEICFWALPSTSREQLMHFFGHELGHYVEKHYRRALKHKRSRRHEELRADMFGWVARQAERMTREALSRLQAA